MESVPRPQLSRVVFAVAAGFFALEAITNLRGGYGYFRDELYYLACSDHLALGYVDQPPLSILALKLARLLLGDSLFALRLWPALAGALVVLVTGLIARELGGGGFAQALSALAASVAPQYLGVCGFYSMNAFDLLAWAVLLLLFARLASGGDPRLWLLFGLVAGLGLENKLSVLFLGAGLGAGILLTPLRRALRERWLWLGAALAALLCVPHLAWQVRNGWPTLEFMRNATLYKNAPLSPLAFLGEQLALMQPATALVWAPGLLALLFARALRPFRALGIAYLAILAIFVLQHGKPYYLTPVYPALFAAGAVAIAQASHERRRWLRPVLVLTVLLLAPIGIPYALPILPVKTFLAYSQALGLNAGSEERDRPNPLGQHYADMFGWRELAEDVARVHASLTPEERGRCAVYAQNYGEAGAIDFFGKGLGLPRAISGHNNYWLWGTGGASGELVIVVGGRLEDNLRHFRDCREAGRHRSEYARSFEADLPIYLCRDLDQPLDRLWPALKDFI